MDLYYRLGVYAIQIPPLRERGDDLALLVDHYVRRLNRELGRDITEVAPEALARLREHSWPGNVRELQSVLKKALASGFGQRPPPGVPAGVLAEKPPVYPCGRRRRSIWTRSSATDSRPRRAMSTRRRSAR